MTFVPDAGLVAKFELNDKVMRFVPGAEPSSVAVIFEFESLLL